MLHSPISQRQTAAPERELQPHIAMQPDGERGAGAEIQPSHTRRKRITPVSVRRDRVKSLSVFARVEILHSDLICESSLSARELRRNGGIAFLTNGAVQMTLRVVSTLSFSKC